jgi:hypothetical protein
MTTKEKAALKIAAGFTRCVSGALLATGHGILAHVLRTPNARFPVARALMQSGQDTVKEGMAEWNK